MTLDNTGTGSGGTALPEAGRQAAHVLLDITSAWDTPGDEQWAARANLALQRLNDVGAVTTTITGPDTVTVDVSNLVGAATVTHHWLLAGLAAATNTTQHDVIARLRAFLDRSAGPHAPTV